MIFKMAAFISYACMPYQSRPSSLGSDPPPASRLASDSGGSDGLRPRKLNARSLRNKLMETANYIST